MALNACLCNAIHSQTLCTAKDMLMMLRARGVVADETTINSVLSAARASPVPHSQQELNWVLEECIRMGAKPSEQLLLNMIQASEDDQDMPQAVWVAAFAVNYRLLPRNGLLHMLNLVNQSVGSHLCPPD